MPDAFSESEPLPRHDDDARRSPPPLPDEARELLRRLLDGEHMLEVFRRELPARSDVPLRVLGCSVKPAKTVRSRKALRAGRTELVYRVQIELADGGRQEVVLFGSTPLAPDFPGAELERQALRAHAAAAPFRGLALRLEPLALGLLFFPLDPGLPALAQITGAEAPQLLAPHLAECRAGARLAAVQHELRHYKPGERAVLRLRAGFGAGPGAPAARHVYAKLFADEHGATSHRELCALWSAARGSRWLRIPEPLGYDAQRRMLVLAEVPGGRALAEWIHCLEHARPLPPGVDLGRLERAVIAAARALAALQRSGVRPEARRAFEDALVSLQKDRELLEDGLQDVPPQLVARALSLLRRLEAAAPRTEALVPSHGGARHKQTVGDEQGLTFVDWDGFCLADPALDAGTFLARLRLEPITNPDGAPELEHLAERFRAELLAQAPGAAQHLALYEGLALSEQVLRSFRRGAAEFVAHGAVARLARAAEMRLDLAERGP